MGAVSAIFEVFTEIATWIVSTFTLLQGLFWTVPEGSTMGHLTFLGVLTVISVGIGLVFLIIYVIQRFLHFRS